MAEDHITFRERSTNSGHYTSTSIVWVVHGEAAVTERFHRVYWPSICEFVVCSAEKRTLPVLNLQGQEGLLY